MKTVFIVNPNAGRGKNFDNVIKKIKELSESRKEDVSYYITKKELDGKFFVQDYCEKYGPARFIACGGDGTLNEILNGAIGKNAEIGVVPIGSGNDFCRNFEEKDSFFDLEKQISADCVECDAIKYTTMLDGKIKKGYCANMFNIGFDCAVADMTNTLKSKTVFSGSMAYLVSIFINLVRKKASKLKVEIDGAEEYSEELLLTSIANGCYCGGGLKTNPIALVNDGFININVVKNISRKRFLTLLPRYINGSYLNISNIERIVTSRKCTKVKITSSESNIRMSVDGEITDAGITEFEIVHNAFKFVVPYRVKNDATIKEKLCI